MGLQGARARRTRVSASGMPEKMKKMNGIHYLPIGIIRTPFKEIAGMPIQPKGAEGIAGSIELEQRFAGGLKDLDGFSHLILLYHFHLIEGYSLEVKPFLDDQVRGLFATRSPKRPNPIGLSIVRLIGIEANTLHIEDVDMIDGTPLLDIKPYVPEFDSRETERIGWVSGKAGNVTRVKADERFG